MPLEPNGSLYFVIVYLQPLKVVVVVIAGFGVFVHVYVDCCCLLFTTELIKSTVVSSRTPSQDFASNTANSVSCHDYSCHFTMCTFIPVLWSLLSKHGGISL